MWASREGHTATVELLLGAGADTEAKNKVRETKRAIYTHTCGYQNGLKEVAPCLREHLYMCSTNSLHTLTCICHLLINSSTSHFPHVFLFFPIFATMVCASLSLCCKDAYTALMLASDVRVSFCPSWLFCHLREHHYMCSITPLFATYSSTFHHSHFPLFASLLLPSSLFATMVCVPPSPSVVRLATLHSFWPRTVVAPQLWSCCWERGLTRRRRAR